TARDARMEEILPRRRIAVARILLVGLALVISLSALWIWFSLTWAYSEGQRAGTLYKLSEKGWLCKTYEAELAQYIVGAVEPELWQFSVRHERLAKELAQAVGSEIRIDYTEHRGVPTTCFAETPYFAQSFTIVQR